MPFLVGNRHLPGVSNSFLRRISRRVSDVNVRRGGTCDPPTRRCHEMAMTSPIGPCHSRIRIQNYEGTNGNRQFWWDLCFDKLQPAPDLKSPEENCQRLPPRCAKKKKWAGEFPPMGRSGSSPTTWKQNREVQQFILTNHEFRRLPRRCQECTFSQPRQYFHMNRLLPIFLVWICFPSWRTLLTTAGVSLPWKARQRTTI